MQHMTSTTGLSTFGPLIGSQRPPRYVRLPSLSERMDGRVANKDADMVQTRLTGAQRRRRELAVPGYASGFDAPLRATADALERAQHARSIVLVEGVSDQIAVETLASLQARDLTKEGVAVVPIGGAQSVSKFLAHFGPAGVGLRVSGLCDAAEEQHFCRQLAKVGYAHPDTRSELERAGFFVCDRDLEDELIRAVGPDAIETILAEEADLASFRTLQKQAAWRDACFD